MKKARAFLRAALILVMVLILSGCAGKDDPKQTVPADQGAQAVNAAAEEVLSQAQMLYDTHHYRDCAVYIAEASGNGYEFEVQQEINAVMGCALYELGNYEAARQAFVAGDLRNTREMMLYAASVCRVYDRYEDKSDGFLSGAKQMMDDLRKADASEEELAFVQAEVNWAEGDCTAAEAQLLQVIDTAADTELQRLALQALADLYAECADMGENSPAAKPNEKMVDILSDRMDSFTDNGMLWERLGLARYALGQEAEAAQDLQKAVDLTYCSEKAYRVLQELYLAAKDTNAADNVMRRYEEAFSEDYVPHAEKALELLKEDGDHALEILQEYAKAVELIRSGDDDTVCGELVNAIAQHQRHGGL